MADDLNFDVKIGADITELTAALDRLSSMLKSEFGPSIDRLESLFSNVGKKGKKAFSEVGDESKKATRTIHHFEEAMEGLSSTIEETAAKFGEAIEKRLKNVTNQTATIVRVRSTERQEMIRNTQIMRDAANKEREEIRANAKIKFAQLQKETVMAREAGARRTVIAQAVATQITNLEKGIGATIAGVARTAVAATSTIFSKLSGLFARSNKQINDGLPAAMQQRGSIMRAQLRAEERQLRESMTKQRIIRESVNQSARTGVVGSTRGLIGGLAVGGGIAGMLGSTFSIGSEFVRGLAVLQAQLNLTGEQMKGVRELSLQLGNDMSLPGVSALDAAQAIQLLSKQFGALGPAAITAAEDAAKGTLQLARAANVSAEEAAGVVGAAVNVFGVAANKATDVADQVAAALKNAAGVSFSDFADAFKQGGAVFAQFQKPAVGAAESLVEFNTALALLARNGVVGSDAGTSLKQFFLQANRGTSDANKALGAITERAGAVGDAFYDANGKARPFPETLDILRKGLKGVSDEQRNSTLQTIFGSDAIRVANALLSVSTEEYAKMAQAMREQGLAAKIAAAQNTGFKGALDAFRSVLETIQIVIYEKVEPALATVTLAIADLVNKIAFGKGAWETIRKGLLGAAIGMGAVLAVKGAVEVFSLLGRALGLLLTPMGAVIALGAIVGGAIAVMMDNSEEFRKTVKGLVGNLRDFIDKGLVWIVKIVREDVIPALKSFGEFLSRNIMPTIEAVKNFVVDTLVPGFVTLAGVISGVVVDAFRTVVNVAKDFWHTIEPLIRPAIDGIHELANAIGALLTGDQSRIRDAFGGAIGGIGASVANVVGAIGEALTPVAQRIFEFFRDLFTPDKVDRYIAGVLDFVEAVGRALGNIISDPMVVKIAAGLAAAAAVIAFRFVKGFIEGIVSNGPELGRMLLDALGAIFKLAIGNLGVVFIGLIAAMVVKNILGMRKAFIAAGEATGGGFIAGFKASIRNAGQFTSSLLTGTTASRVGPSAGDTTMRNLNNEMRILGITGIDPSTTAGFKAARAEIDRLKGSLTEAQLAGLSARDSLKNFSTLAGSVTSGLGTAAKGAMQVFTAAFRAGGQSNLGARVAESIAVGLTASDARAKISASGTSYWTEFSKALKGGVGNVKAGLSQAWVAIGEFAQKEGVSKAQVVGQKVGGALLAAVGGFMAGNAAGSAGASGAGLGITALMSGLSAGLATANPIIGVAAGGFTLLGGAIGALNHSNEEAEKRFKKVSDALRSKVIPAMEDGTIATLDMEAALNSFESGDSTLADQINSLVSPETRRTLSDFGLTAQDIADAFGQGSKAVDALMEHVTDFNSDEFGYSEAWYAARDAADEVKGIYKDIGKTIDDINIEEKFNPSIIEKAATSGRSLWESVRDIGNESKKMALEKVVSDSTTAINTMKAAADATLGSITSLFSFGSDGNTLAGATNSAIVAVSNMGPGLAEAVKKSMAGGVQGTVGNAEVNIALDTFGAQVSSVVSQGVKDGVIVDEATARHATQSVKDALIASLDLSTPEGQAARDRINAEFEASMSNLQPKIDEYAAEQAGIKAGEKAAAAAQEALTSNPISPQVKGPKKSDITRPWGVVGSWINEGLAAGIDASNAAQRAAQRMADEVIHISRTAFAVASPSKVFRYIGEMITAGLAEGITADTEDVAGAARSVVDRVVSAAVDSAGRGAAIVRSAMSGLFDAMTGADSPTPGGGTAFGVTNATAGITTANQGFLSTVASNAQALFAASSKRPGERTADEANLVGESFVSLNPNDVLGASNIASIQAVLQSIADFGSALLANGTPVASMITQVQARITKFVNDAVKIGFNRGGLLKLIDQFGLSPADLAEFAKQAGAISIPTNGGTGGTAPDQTSLPGIPIGPSVAAVGARAMTAPAAASGSRSLSSATPAAASRSLGDVTINMYLPTGDPEANAMAVVNRLASLV